MKLIEATNYFLNEEDNYNSYTFTIKGPDNRNNYSANASSSLGFNNKDEFEQAFVIDGVDLKFWLSTPNTSKEWADDGSCGVYGKYKALKAWYEKYKDKITLTNPKMFEPKPNTENGKYDFKTAKATFGYGFHVYGTKFQFEDSSDFYLRFCKDPKIDYSFPDAGDPYVSGSRSEILAWIEAHRNEINLFDEELSMGGNINKPSIKPYATETEARAVLSKAINASSLMSHGNIKEDKTTRDLGMYNGGFSVKSDNGEKSLGAFAKIDDDKYKLVTYHAGNRSRRFATDDGANSYDASEHAAKYRKDMEKIVAVLPSDGSVVYEIDTDTAYGIAEIWLVTIVERV